MTSWELIDVAPTLDGVFSAYPHNGLQFYVCPACGLPRKGTGGAEGFTVGDRVRTSATDLGGPGPSALALGVVGLGTLAMIGTLRRFQEWRRRRAF